MTRRPEPTDPKEPPEPEREPEGSDDDASPTLRATKGESVGASVGSFMAGIEQLVFQRRPPAIELVRQATPVRGISGDGTEVTIDLPDLPELPRPPKPER